MYEFQCMLVVGLRGCLVVWLLGVGLFGCSVVWFFGGLVVGLMG